MDIRDIYLQSATYRVACKDIASKMLNHAYLIECADDSLSSSFANLLASQMFCSEDGNPCGKCLNCKKIEHGNMVDLIYFPKDQNKNIMVDDIKELVNDAFTKPIENDFKVYILRNLDKATIQAQNKLLKTLEEPPTFVKFILTCRSRANILPTICSRVKVISESPKNQKIIKEYLDSLGIKDSQSIASICGGKISTALELSGKTDATAIINLAFETLLSLKTSGDILRLSSKILALKQDFKVYLDTLQLILRDILICLHSKDLVFCNYEKFLKELSIEYNPKTIKKITGEICKIYCKLDFNCNMTAIVDSLLLKILEVKFLCQK